MRHWSSARNYADFDRVMSENDRAELIDARREIHRLEKIIADAAVIVDEVAVDVAKFGSPRLDVRLGSTYWLLAEACDE